MNVREDKHNYQAITFIQELGTEGLMSEPDRFYSLVNLSIWSFNVLVKTHRRYNQCIYMKI